MRVRTGWHCVCHSTGDSAQANGIDRYYLTWNPDLFGDDGEVRVASTEDFLRNYMVEFREHVARVLTVLPR